MSEVTLANTVADKLTKLKSRLLKYFAVSLLLLMAVFSAYVWLTLHWSYSDGERAGYLQKFSRKGWLCKTWEGEITLIAQPGAMPEKFIFTVRDDKLAEQISASIGKRVDLNYEQHRGLVSSCFGETEYFVTAVRVIGP